MKSPRELVAEALDCKVSEVDAESMLGSPGKWDSFGHLNVVLSLERYYGIEVNEESVREFQTLEAIEQYYRNNFLNQKEQ